MRNIDDSLPPGTRIDHYVIEYTLSRGGFSIVYLANVSGLDKHVAIKEYIPRKFARRDEDMRVAPATEDDVDRFNHGRKLFFKEASTLATLKHNTIVNVFNFFSANGTAYMVMEYQPGENLEAYIKKYQGNLSETFMRTVFPPLLEGLKVLHDAGLTHLDIKPANVHLIHGGKPLLLDFGAVHQMMSTRQYQPSQVITPGYSPIEQYKSKGYVGPWSDIYALGATMRSCLEGCPPPPAKERAENDEMRPATELFKKHYSETLLSTIDWAMEVDPLNRPQNIDELLEYIDSEGGEKPSPSGIKRFTNSLFSRLED